MDSPTSTGDAGPSPSLGKQQGVTDSGIKGIMDG